MYFWQGRLSNMIGLNQYAGCHQHQLGFYSMEIGFSSIHSIASVSIAITVSAPTAAIAATSTVSSAIAAAAPTASASASASASVAGTSTIITVGHICIVRLYF